MSSAVPYILELTFEIYVISENNTAFLKLSFYTYITNDELQVQNYLIDK